MVARKNATCIVGRIWQHSKSRLFPDLGAASTTSSSRAYTSTGTGTGKDTDEGTHTSGKDKFFSLLDDRVTGPFAVERKPVFAVVELAGTQYKVTADDLIITEKLPGVDVNDKIRLNRVLLLGSTTETVIGRPTVEGASVIAAVEEQFLDGKVLVFKKRRRKNSRRLNGHRQPLTSLRVLDVLGDVNFV